MELIFLIGVLVLGVCLLGGIAAAERPAGSLQTVELRFGGDASEAAVAAMLGCVSGLPSDAVVILDLVADEDGIRHLLHASPATLDTLRAQWRGVLPSLRVDVREDIPSAYWTSGALLRLSGRQAVLRSDEAASSSAALLGALQPLSRERLLIRWQLGSAWRPTPPDGARRDSRGGAGGLAGVMMAGSALSADHLRMLRTKYAGPLLSGIGVVAVAAGHPGRAAHLLSRVTSAMRPRGSAHGQLTIRRRSPQQIARLLGRPSLRRPDLYAPGELAPLAGFPIDAPVVPGLVLGSAPVLLPSARIPRTGRVLAVSTWPGMNRRLAQPVLGGLSHGLIVGPSGVGKSNLMCNLIVQDFEAGRGLLVVDGKGDLERDLVARIPAGREDVIVLNPGAGGPQPGLRLFGHGDPHRVADLILHVLAAVAPGEWGPMSAKWLRAGLLLLACAEDASLADLPFVYTSDAFRGRLLARLDDPLARETWAAYAEMRVAERAHQVAAPLNKIDEIIGRRVIRTIVGQTSATAKLDMNDVLRRGKVVIVSLSPGQIGGPAARLLGALVVHQFFSAVQARVAVAPQARRPFFAYVDEPKVMGDVGAPLDSLYELARGMSVGATLGVQSLSQLPAELRSAAMTNSSTLVAFRQNSADARLLAPELPGVSSEALQHLGKYEVLMRVGLGPGDVSAPVSGRTLPPPPVTSDPEVVRRASAARFGTDPAEVEAALAERHRRTGAGDTPVGFLRRQP